VKRSNRLVILVGVLLAVLAFVAIVILLNQRPEAAAPEKVLQTVLVATEDIDIGEEVTPQKVEERDIEPEAVQGTALVSSTIVAGQPALFPIPEGSQVSGEAIGLGRTDVIDISARLNPGEKAIAFQVDRVTGLDFLVTEGDSIDIIMSQAITVLQETADSAANTDENAPARFEAITGLEAARSVKAILQDKRVVYVSATRAQQPEPVDTNGDGVVNEQDEQPAQAAIDSVIIVFAGTTQDAEVIKFAQNALGEQGALTAIVRHADDDAVEETLGITIDQLVSEYGLRIPDIVEQLGDEETTPAEPAP
jgi:Flp pilus assembly protein CpaB